MTAIDRRRLILLGGAVLLLLTTSTRLIELGKHELWYDEICSFLGAIDTSPRLVRWWPYGNDEHSPLPFIEMKLSMAVFGESAWALRLPAACYAVLGVMALYVVVGRSINWATAWWAALLLAMNPYVLEHHREARMYPGWFFYLTVAVGVAWECARLAKAQPCKRSIYGWWFALGMIFMIMFAQTTHAILSIAGIIVWLMLQIVLHWRQHRRDVARRIAIGTSCALAVFCFNWSTYGLIKLFHSMMRECEPAKSSLPDIDHLMIMAGELSGYIATPFGLLLWLAALVGMVMLAKQGRGAFVLLVVLAGAMSWLGYSSILSRHFYSSRYLFGMLLIWAIGLGAVFNALWRPAKIPGRLAVLAMIIALSTVWLPVWRVMYTTPKNPVADVLSVARKYSRPGDVMVIVPSAVYIFVKLYDTGHARPMAAMVHVDKVDTSVLPPAIWVFVENPVNHMYAIANIIKAYGLSPDDYIPDLKKHAKGRPYCVARISADGVDPIAISPKARPYNCRILTLER